MKKIGLFGGTFDPVHNGHLIIAEYLREELELEEIWFIPARIHPLKDNKDISSGEDRYRMLDLAAANNHKFRVNDVELQGNKTSYTIDTLKELHDENRRISPEFYFLIGMDNVNELHRWKQPDEIIKMCKLVAFGRPGFNPGKHAKAFLPDIEFVHVPLLEISSTFIRNRFREGRSVRYLVPDEIIGYIQEKQLYK